MDIKNMIYEIRGKYVMLDSDLARLYECKNGTKTINQAVGRHTERFPNDFCFKLTKAYYALKAKKYRYISINGTFVIFYNYLFSNILTICFA